MTNEEAKRRGRILMIAGAYPTLGSEAESLADAILTALSAGEGLRDALADARNALHRDRTGLAAALNAIRAEIKGREWLRPGFGWANYGYEKHTADTLREEIGWAFDAMLKILDDALRASGRIADDGVCAADSALAAPAPQEEITGTVAQMDRALTAPCGSDAGQAAVAGSSPAGSHQPAPPARDGAALIAAERQRQVTACGWTPEHDDQHKDGALAKAAACYALEGLPRALRHRRVRDGCTLDYQRDDGMISVPNLWPWAAEDWNVKNRLSNLVRAGALIAAEIDRLLRAKLCPQHEGVPGGQGCTCLAGTYAGQLAGRAHDAGCPSAPASATCAMVPVRADVIAFLNGDTQLDGLWFGDVWFGKHRPAGKGAFWWRKYLPATPASAPKWYDMRRAHDEARDSGKPCPLISCRYCRDENPASAPDYADVLPRTAKRMQRMMQDSASAPEGDGA